MYLDDFSAYYGQKAIYYTPSGYEPKYGGDYNNPIVRFDFNDSSTRGGYLPMIAGEDDFELITSTSFDFNGHFLEITGGRPNNFQILCDSKNLTGAIQPILAYDQNNIRGIKKYEDCVLIYIHSINYRSSDSPADLTRRIVVAIRIEPKLYLQCYY